MKNYDKAKTSYQRVLESEKVSDKIKEKLRQYYHELNPVTLRKEIESRLEKIFKLSQRRSQTHEMQPDFDKMATP